MAPVVHPKEISSSVHIFPVSGVSIPQEVGGTRSSSVVYKVDSDEVAGVCVCVYVCTLCVRVRVCACVYVYVCVGV